MTDKMRHNKLVLPASLKSVVAARILQFTVEAVLFMWLDTGSLIDDNEPLAFHEIFIVLLMFFCYTQIIRLIRGKSSSVKLLAIALSIVTLYDISGWQKAKELGDELMLLVIVAVDILCLILLARPSSKKWVADCSAIEKNLSLRPRWLLMLLFNLMFALFWFVYGACYFILKQ